MLETNLREFKSGPRITGALFLLGALILAIEPVRWLVTTWRDPSYDSSGGWIFVAVVALFVWSVTSERVVRSRDTSHAWWLLLATALIRLVGQLLAIDVLGALALAVDVYALGVLSGIGRRRRAVAPFWLAVVFAFSLPIERIFQRLIGYALQHVSAAGSCSVLGVLFDDVVCEGTEITLAGQQVLVDLPCSGARGLVIVLVLFAGLAALVRPGLRQAVLGGLLAAVSALVANTFRIAVLALGLAFSDVIGGVDVMAQPWHDLVGLVALALGVLPLVVWARLQPPPHPDGSTDASEDEPPAPDDEDDTPHHTKRLWLAPLFLAAAIAILFVPHHPVDVAETDEKIELPLILAGEAAEHQKLSDREAAYFTQYGGAAAKARYGPHTLLVVETSAPLRHLHAPDECLSGAGFEVESRGIDGENLPGATYLATDPDGDRWRVRVTYVSDTGEVATSISEVVFRWMGQPDSRWRAYQRVYPLWVSLEEVERFDRSVATMFGIPETRIPRD
ncbi:MAG: exosortase T [Persicimonas sp.]